MSAEGYLDSGHLLSFGDGFEVNLDERTLLKDSLPLSQPLAGKEFDIVSYLALKPDTPASTEELCWAVWGMYDKGLANALRVYINWSRNKLEPDIKSYKESVLQVTRGLGYYVVGNSVKHFNS